MNNIHDVNDAQTDRDLLNKLLALSIAVAADMDRGLATRDLTRARANLLWEVAQSGPTTQRDVAARLRVTPRNVTALVDALEETGFVARTEHETDRRATLVRLTDKGEAAVARMNAEADDLAGTIFSGLSAKDRAVIAGAFSRALASFGPAGP